MKIILIEDVPNLGVLGDHVQVKPGYARNFLIPQGKAILASSKKSKELAHRMQFFQKLRAAAIESAHGEGAKLLLLQLETTKKAGLGGKLFGSVTNKDISELLLEHGFEIPRRNILPYEPIKTVGTHRVSVKLHTEVKVDIHIKVLGETPEAEAKVARETEPPENSEPSASSEPSEISQPSASSEPPKEATESAS